MDPYNFTLNTIKPAGEMLLSYYEKGVKSQFKNDNPRDIVTEADYAINDFLISKIRSQFPDHLIYSEEGVSNRQTEITEKPTWMLDPIDGTSNFSRQIPHFSISMGLVQKGEVQLGAVYNPVTGELYHFKKGSGVYRNDVQVQVSVITKLDSSFILMRAGRKKDLWQWGSELYLKLLQNANKTSSLGSSALDICFVASGKVEAVIYGNISICDIVAAVGMLKEAGGYIVDKNGNEIPITAHSSEPQTAIFTNNAVIRDKILKLV